MATLDSVDAASTTDQVAELEAQVLRWRHRALVTWAERVADAEADAQLIQKYTALEAEKEIYRREITALYGTTSWRLTRPLRAVMTAAKRVQGRSRVA